MQVDQTERPNEVKHIGSRMYFVKICIRERGTGQTTYALYDNLNWTLRLKYDWFFKYKAALCQIENPRKEVLYFEGHRQHTEQDKSRKEVKDKANQSMLKTRYKNKLQVYIAKFEDYKRAYSGLFPIEDEPAYNTYLQNIQAAERKIKRIVVPKPTEEIQHK